MPEPTFLSESIFEEIFFSFLVDLTSDFSLNSLLLDSVILSIIFLFNFFLFKLLELLLLLFKFPPFFSSLEKILFSSFELFLLLSSFNSMILVGDVIIFIWYFFFVFLLLLLFPSNFSNELFPSLWIILFAVWLKGLFVIEKISSSVNCLRQLSQIKGSCKKTVFFFKHSLWKPLLHILHWIKFLSL